MGRAFQYLFTQLWPNLAASPIVGFFVWLYHRRWVTQLHDHLAEQTTELKTHLEHLQDTLHNWLNTDEDEEP